MPNDELCWPNISPIEFIVESTTADQPITLTTGSDSTTISVPETTAEQVGQHQILAQIHDTITEEVIDQLQFTVVVNAFDLPDICQDDASLILQIKENQTGVSLPDEPVEITVGDDPVTIKVPSFEISSLLPTAEDVDALCAPIVYSILVYDYETGDLVSDQTIAAHLPSS